MNNNEVLALRRFANELRRTTMISIAGAGVGHVGGSMSIAEVIAALYGGVLRHRPENPDWPERDRLVLSKGHAGPILYAALANRGYFPVEWLDTLNQLGTRLPSHADRIHTPGVDMSTGSLGQGASTACGLALSERMLGRDSRVFLILGDGEINEGEVWEAMLFAADKKLTNLITIIDVNKGQVDGFCKDVCDMGDMSAKFQAFGLEVYNIPDGHDMRSVYEALNDARNTVHERPVCLILNTVKAKDCPCFEGKPSSHHVHVSPEQLDECLRHFDEIDAALEKEVVLL